MRDVPESVLQPYSTMLRSLAALLAERAFEHVERLCVSLHVARDAVVVIDLAQGIAHEYGLRASSHTAGQLLTVTFERRQASRHASWRATSLRFERTQG